jgi:hypothetical protein
VHDPLAVADQEQEEVAAAGQKRLVIAKRAATVPHGMVAAISAVRMMD